MNGYDDRFVIFIRELIESIYNLISGIFNPLFTFLNAPILGVGYMSYYPFDLLDIPGFFINNIGPLLGNAMIFFGRAVMNAFGLPETASVWQLALAPAMVMILITIYVWKNIILSVFK